MEHLLQGLHGVDAPDRQVVQKCSALILYSSDAINRNYTNKQEEASTTPDIFFLVTIN